MSLKSFFRKLRSLFKKEDFQPKSLHEIFSVPETPQPEQPKKEEYKPPVIPPMAEDPLMGFPQGAYRFGGAWYVPYGSTHAGPFANADEWNTWRQRADARDKNSKEWDELDGQRVYGGIWKAGRDLTDDDAKYLYVANVVFQEQKGGSQAGNLFYDFQILQGTRVEINREVNRGEDLLNQSHQTYQAVLTNYHGKLKMLVDPLLGRM